MNSEVEVESDAGSGTSTLALDTERYFRCEKEECRGQIFAACINSIIEDVIIVKFRE